MIDNGAWALFIERHAAREKHPLDEPLTMVKDFVFADTMDWWLERGGAFPGAPLMSILWKALEKPRWAYRLLTGCLRDSVEDDVKGDYIKVAAKDTYWAYRLALEVGRKPELLEAADKDPLFGRLARERAPHA